MTGIVVVTKSPDVEGNLLWLEMGRSLTEFCLVVPFEARYVSEDLLKHGFVTSLKTVPTKRLSRQFRYTYGLQSLLKEHSPSLVHVVAEPWALDVTQSIHAGFATIVHSAENRYSKESFVADAIRFGLAARNLRRAAGGVAWNSTALEAMRVAGLRIEGPSCISPSTTRLRLKPVKSVSLDRKPLSVLFVGRLEPDKSVETLIRAIDGYADQIQLSVVGDGSLRGELEQLSASLSNPASFLGYCDAQRVRELMRASDVLVLPSVDLGVVCEQFGLVLLEAMAEGTAIVASNACSIPEVVGNAGILCPPGDVEALRGALLRLAQDRELLAVWSSRAADRYQRWSPATLSESIVRLWRECLVRDQREGK